MADAKNNLRTKRPDPNDREYVQSLERGVKVLLAFDAEHSQMTLSEVAARTGLTRATARRLLLTLTRLGLISTNGKQFRLQPRVLEFGFRYLSGLPWWHAAQPVIDSLSREIQQPCSISVLDGSDVVYVARAVIKRLVDTNINIGSRFPAFCTAAGRAILSRLPDEEVDLFLSKVETTKFTGRTITDISVLRDLILTSGLKGYAVSDQELEIGLFGIAVPIMDNAGRPAAALTASLHLIGTSPSKIVKSVLPLLLKSAGEISGQLQLQEFQPSGSRFVSGGVSQ